MIRTATLYALSRSNVVVHSDTIPYFKRSDERPYIRAINSEDYFEPNQVIHVSHLPIEHWVLENGERFFIAFEPDLRRIIQHKIHTESHAVRQELSGLIDDLHEENIRLQSRTIWDMIRSKFKRKSK